MQSELLCADGFMIVDSLFVRVINSSQTIEAYSAVQRTVKVVTNELVGLGMLIAVIEATVHIVY